MMSKEVQYHSIKKMKSNFKEMNNMRKQKILCDSSIKCGNKILFIHKIVLASSSEYFNKMFTGNFMESHIKEFTLNEITSPDAVELLIDYMYTSKLKITEHNVQDLLVTSNFLLLFDVYDVCINFMKQSKNVENCLNLRTFASSYNLDNLDKVCLFFILDHFSEIVNSNNFLLLSFHQIKELVQNDHLNATEEKIYEAIILWINHDVKNRSKWLLELLQTMRLPLISMKYIEDKIEKENLIISNSECKDLLHSTKKICALINNGCSIPQSPNIYIDRTRAQVILISIEICYISAMMMSRRIQYYDVMDNKLYPSTALMDIIENYDENRTLVTKSIILHDGRLFYMTQSETNNAIFGTIYDGNLKTWENTSNSYLNHKWPSLIQFYDRIYLISNEGVEYYDILQKLWNKVQFKIPYTRRLSFFELIVVSNRIYIFTNGNQCYCYNPKNDVGQLICPMSKTKTCFTLCSLNNKLYVIGGLLKGNDVSIIKNVDVYNPQTDTWLCIANMHYPRFTAGAFVINGLMYVLGGSSNNTIEYYDPKTGKWTICKLSLSLTQSFVKAFTLGIESNIRSEDILKYYSIA